MEAESPYFQVKDDLFKHRQNISELRHAFDVNASGASMDITPLETSTPLETPVATVVGPRAGGVRFAPVPEDSPLDADALGPRRSVQVIARDVLLFTNPALSGAVLVGGSALITAVHYLLSASPLTLLSAICYLLLADIGLNFVRGLISRRWQEQGFWRGSAASQAVAERLAAAVDAASHAHDHFLSARDPVLTLKVAAGLWALALVGSYLSFWNVVTLGFVVAFTVPAGYVKYQTTLTNLYQNVTTAAKARWDTLGMNRKQKAAGLGVALLLLWIQSAWSTRLVALLVGALAVRCHLKPAEVEYIRAHAEPYTQSVKKSARRISLAATDFAKRGLGAKPHAR